MFTPINPVWPKIDRTFILPKFPLFVTIKLVVVTAFDATTLPMTWILGPPVTGVVPIPMFEVTNVTILAVDDTFAEDACIAPVVRAFDA